MPRARLTRSLAFAFALALALASACATPRSAEQRSLCPEAKDLPCATDRECSLDAARGCFVCACRPVDAGPGSPAAAAARPDVPAFPPPPTQR